VDASAVGMNPTVCSATFPSKLPLNPGLQRRSFETVLAANQPRIDRFARRYSQSRPWDREDLIQVGRLALWNACRRYDARRGHPFEHYATRAIVRAMRREVKREERHWTHRADPRTSTDQDDLVLDQVEHAAGPSAATNDDAPEYRTVLLAQVRARVEQLSPTLRQLYQLRYVEGKSQGAVARAFGVTQQRISQLERELGRLICVAA
jgi:RNA polymerase sigma factor (sigma-70 family)